MLKNSFLAVSIGSPSCPSTTYTTVVLCQKRSYQTVMRRSFPGSFFFRKRLNPRLGGLGASSQKSFLGASGASSGFAVS